MSERVPAAHTSAAAMSFKPSIAVVISAVVASVPDERLASVKRPVPAFQTAVATFAGILVISDHVIESVFVFIALTSPHTMVSVFVLIPVTSPKK